MVKNLYKCMYFNPSSCIDAANQTHCCIVFPTAVKLNHMAMYSLVPRPSPSFPSLAAHLTVVEVTGS